MICQDAEAVDSIPVKLRRKEVFPDDKQLFWASDQRTHELAMRSTFYIFGTRVPFVLRKVDGADDGRSAPGG